LQLFQALRNRAQPNEPKPAAPSLATAPTVRPIPPNKDDDKALPASPPVLQIPPQQPKIRLESQPNPVPARQIPAHAPPRDTMQPPTCK
jgi:hypothetical protein